MINRRERKVKNKGNSILVDAEENLEIEYSHKTKWKISEKLKSTRHSFTFAKKYANGLNFSKKDLESDGFSVPILFVKKDGLGLTLPFNGFGVNDVEDNVGMDRMLDVVDVQTQDAIGMTMREWCRYFNRPKKERLLNVISLEYSQTKMDKIVKAPDVVLEIDWLESCWPQSCRDVNTDNKSYLKCLTYPKVRKYCLMSVKGCYTDFHIDLGGTSVWYHIFKGEKVFWMIPPTEQNLRIFEDWSLSVDQSSHFFPDLVEQCQRVHLRQGNTFLIPSGWIHGVYTPVDSLVFGGNFLHSYSIDRQLQIWAVEERLKVGAKYRYPFFVEMHWYVLASLVGRASGTSYLKKAATKKARLDPTLNTALSDRESCGLRIIRDWLAILPPSLAKAVPDRISDPVRLLADCDNLLKSLSPVPCKSASLQLMEPYVSLLVDCQHIGPSSPQQSTEQSLHHKTVGRPRARKRTPREAEMPTDLYGQITASRPGARTVRRPQRLIEAALAP